MPLIVTKITDNAKQFFFILINKNEITHAYSYAPHEHSGQQKRNDEQGDQRERERKTHAYIIRCLIDFNLWHKMEK